ncbi:uncharacterized protein HD556DRAFT_439934 [Suillus plorans]|uniref:Uncharacterized protein n=1 Tax=Suillus plorans TaxID=116603 RepID=A0A9P7AQ96_9AGAM|nr:uncharacterized protein HD556DRAFT_439934 [Suillus plorans]KAG1794108.1 hypothetical protein HD556DRAFT_439934 [Suillus plorans]
MFRFDKSTLCDLEGTITLLWATGSQLVVPATIDEESIKGRLLLTSLASYSSVMESPIRSHSGNLPMELLIPILEDAAQLTFSPGEQHVDKNFYSTAVSLCRVSRLFRRIILPKMLHTVFLRGHEVTKFANALLMQKAYAEKESDLFFDYTSAIQRMWIGNHWASLSEGLPEFKLNMSILLPVILAVPVLAIDSEHLQLLVRGVEDAWTTHEDLNIDREYCPFPGKTQNLTIMSSNGSWDPFDHNKKTSIFLASIPRLTCLPALEVSSDVFRDISRGLRSTGSSLQYLMDKVPWAQMTNLQTFSVVYPHLGPPFSMRSYIDPTRGLDLHVERLNVSAPLYKQDPHSFPWGTPPFSVTNPGEKNIRTNGLSLEVTRKQTHFCRLFFSWENAWACGLTDDEGYKENVDDMIV